jgi:type I restriction enzyme S subunit
LVWLIFQRTTLLKLLRSFHSLISFFGEGIELKDGLDTEFLYIFLNSNKFIDSIKGHDQSLGVPHISPTQVESIEIPVPPIEEQRKIAEKLNGQMQEVEKLKKTLTEQLEAIKKMPSALLRKAFAGEI